MALRMKAVWGLPANQFTDADAQTFRCLIRKYSFNTVLKELGRVANAYSQQAPQWGPVRVALRRAIMERDVKHSAPQPNLLDIG